VVPSNHDRFFIPLEYEMMSFCCCSSLKGCKGIFVSIEVEDEPAQRGLLAEMLLDHGRLEEAENGRVAIEKFRRSVQTNEIFDLIFLDIKMPGMDGHEVLKQIKEIESRNRLVTRQNCILIGKYPVFNTQTNSFFYLLSI